MLQTVTVTKLPVHACQQCGSERKLVETIIDDEFVWNPATNQYEPNKFADSFEHTDNQRCADCQHEWTGV